MKENKKAAIVLYVDTRTGETFTSEGTGEQLVPSDMPGVKGIFVGGCVKRGVGTSIHNQRYSVNAHAHIGDDSFRGWICYQNPTIYTHPDYAYVRWHEYAHILANAGHNDRWRRVMKELGQPIPPHFSKRTRPR